MTDRILSLLRKPRKRPEMDAVVADRLALMRYRVRQLGDVERDLNRWKDDYRMRKGRAA